MAFWDRWFGTGKKAAEAYRPEYKTPQQTEAGKTSLDLLKSRSTGQGTAFSPEKLTMYGNPYAEKAMRGYQKVLQPAIAESYASRGLGSSNLAAGAETDALGNTLSDIGTNWAELNKWNEALKQSGIESASSGLRDYMGRELNQANYQTQGTEAATNLQNQMNEAQRVSDQDKIYRPIETAANIASMFTPQGSLSGAMEALMKKLSPRTATGYTGYDTAGAMNYLMG